MLKPVLARSWSRTGYELVRHDLKYVIRKGHSDHGENASTSSKRNKTAKTDTRWVIRTLSTMLVMKPEHQQHQDTNPKASAKNAKSQTPSFVRLLERDCTWDTSEDKPATHSLYLHADPSSMT